MNCIRGCTILSNFLECTLSYACQIPVCRDTLLHRIDRFTRYRQTHAGDSLSPSAVPSSVPNTEWEPGSGFRIIDTTPRPPTSRLPPPPPPPPRLATRLRLRRCRASPDERVHGIAARRYVRRSTPTHPGERWLARTRSWVSNPPPSGEEDRFTAVPTRRGNAHHPKGGARVLLRSPHKSHQALYNQL
jgi:hypothetical protein